ncbi:sensor histidine kinase [Streptomyces sp. 5-8]|uniref:Sensor histidine kinase n=1 Tax=Streptomyces musisoli TaxID=2802280 RepID=A0ABS1NX33_9ACTN|nr:sensor histidine kinase [Streptomyces musisoli]MBL1104659.1 sensor histidine kinase [Streptomyces musisoli]
MTWRRNVRRRVRTWQSARSEWKAARDEWKAEYERSKAARRAAGKKREFPDTDHPGPPPTGFALLPWLLLGLGAFSNLLQGETPNPWIGGLGLPTFNSLYIYVTFRSFDRVKRESVSTRVALGLMGLLTTGLALGYGGDWLTFFPLLGLATGAALRGRGLGRTGLLLALYAGAIAYVRGGWDDATGIGYATFLSSMVTAAILGLSEAVRELRAAREELARRAVEKERLRFSRDLHDLLGHTLSVIVVKSEAARRLAPRNMDAALAQITDIESVGRQALTEIREAVTGYREGSLATELTRARSALSAASVEPVFSQSGTPLDPQTEALLGWVVREAVTNVVRHSRASRCEIAVESTAERVRLTVTDNGTGPATNTGADTSTGTGTGTDTGTGTGIDTDTGTGTGTDTGARTDPGTGVSAAAGAREGIGGTGLKGLTERLAAAGGSLTAGPAPRGGFTVTADLPVRADELTPAAAAVPRAGRPAG